MSVAKKNIERVRKAVPRGIARKLWVKSGGRCQYTDCNKPLWKDELMQRDMNKAYISHIIAAKDDGPRGEKVLSEKLELSFDNLLLLCDECHNRIDKAQLNGHPKQILIKMKKDHELRIELLTGLQEEKKSHLLFYTCKIGAFLPTITFKEASAAIIPEYFPVSDNPIEIGMGFNTISDDMDDFWIFQNQQLEEAFNQKVRPLLDKGVNHFSVFGIAPQPLLIKLGTLLSELAVAEIYQSHREPKQTWKWQNDMYNIDVKLLEPQAIKTKVALIISLSDKVNYERIHKVLGADVSIWEITVPEPNRNILKNKETLEKFKNQVRNAFSNIRKIYGQDSEIHLFPVMPNSCAIEAGRVWMPKVDLPLIIYDQNNNRNGFYKALTI
ncbi:SAVED domain-containing protein [Aequorivita sp. F47161]|uniref:SAVED domain-containing protein n=1 Tax=Aequorivita vitellina TaxID=2874475 RepID=A0A9X1QWM1_9FLAO|nr:SAVED domain-containing protein [Aequorivita vitellina]MCG2420085.1 SAVED domain-containing protein [Aequorivita vitellina]